MRTALIVLVVVVVIGVAATAALTDAAALRTRISGARKNCPSTGSRSAARREDFRAGQADGSARIVPASGAVTAFTWQGTKRVTPVLNEGSCGATLFMSVAAAGESVWNTGQALSSQQLVDCLSDQDQCCGGFPDTAMADMVHAPWMSADEYPYKGTEEQCQLTNSSKPSFVEQFPMAQMHNATAQQVHSLLQKKGVLVAAICVNSAFQMYADGVLSGKDCPPCAYPDHTVAIVGIALDSHGRPYAIGKNQWGTSWGVDGYVNLDLESNACSVLSWILWFDQEIV
eukprot:ANDGO_08327.mRNA.1 Cysteine proteinase 1